MIIERGDDVRAGRGGPDIAIPGQISGTVTPPTRSEWFTALAAQLWPAWKGLARWEETVASELSEPLGDIILLLWSVHRLGDGSAGGSLLDAALDEDFRPTMSDPVLDDIVQLAFALGAAWAEDRASVAAVASRPVVVALDIPRPDAGDE